MDVRGTGSKQAGHSSLKCPDEEDYPPEEVSDAMQEREGRRNRDVIRFLVQTYPLALVTENNFLAVPVDTVLETTKATASKFKNISIFGLFNDPPTARLLLLEHRKLRNKGVLPAMKSRHLSALRELNWMARKLALQVSFVGHVFDAPREAVSVKGKVSSGKAGGIRQVPPKKKELTTDSVDARCKNKNNLLARLRWDGHGDIICVCLSYL